MSDARPAATRSLSFHPLALIPVALSAYVYYPITGVYFFGDDFLHLGRIAAGHEFAFFIAPFGGHILHLRNLAFLVSWWLFGMHAAPWFWTVLVTHVLNVWLLFGLVDALTGSVVLACFGATLWGICPLSIGTLGFYSVFGQAMATTFVLLALCRIARLAAANAPMPTRTAWGCYLLLLAAATCFGTGVGVALVFPLVLFALAPATWRQPRVRLAYLALPVVTAAMYFALKRLYVALEGFSMEEMLLETIAFTGVVAPVVMLAHLVAVAIAGTVLAFFFDVDRYVALLDPRGWIAVGVFVVGLVGVVVWGDAKARRATLAMVILTLGIYGIIAVGRASVYSAFHMPVIGAAASLRYHYIGTMPIAVLVCLMVREVGRRVPVGRVGAGMALGAALVVMMVGFVLAKPWIDLHPGVRTYFARTEREIRDAIAKTPPGETVTMENGVTPGELGIFLEIIFPGRAGVFLLLTASGEMKVDRPVRFIEPNPKVLVYWGARPADRLTALLDAPPELKPKP